MLQLSSILLNKPVVSLRTGSQVALVYAPLINLNTLKIEGFYCKDQYRGQSLILLYQDIREFIGKDYIVNDYDVLAHPSELVRLKDTIDKNYELIGKPVVTISKEKVGKVSDYAVEIETMYIQKIYVTQSIIKNFTGGSLSIDRGQIHEVTDKKIIIQDLIKANAIAATAVAA